MGRWTSRDFGSDALGTENAGVGLDFDGMTYELDDDVTLTCDASGCR